MTHNNTISKTLLLFLGFTFTTILGSFGQMSTTGKEFWLGFMDNNGSPSSQDYGSIMITANEASVGEIIYNGVIIPFELQIGEQFFYTIDEFDALHRNSDQIESKGIYINSSGKVAVHAFNERTVNFRSTDGTVILPVSSLGKEYYITSHFELVTTSPTTGGQNLNNQSTFLIVAVEDNTTVEITLQEAVAGKPANQPYTIELNAGQSYQFKADLDLSGTRIRVIGDNAMDCNNIAVFGGNKWTAVGNCGEQNDHLFQQAFPVSTWGTEFLHVPLANRTSGELLKIVSSKPNTVIDINGNTFNINEAGNFIQVPIGQNQSASIVSNQPISTTVFARSQACNQPGINFDLGDPFMITYQSNDQILTSAIFSPLRNRENLTFHFLNLITQTNDTNLTFLNGQNINDQFQPFPFNPNYSFAQIPLIDGIYNLENEMGFIGYVYGFGPLDSYGFAIGTNLDNIDFKIESDYEFDIDENPVACLNSESTWTIEPEDSIFTYFIWDFGDGSEVKVGKEVTHTYTEIGTFEIKVTASLSELTCDEQQDIILEVEVQDIVGRVIGPVNSCPLVEEIEYVFESNDEYSKVEWEVSGGEIEMFSENKVVIKWGEPNQNAWVKAIPFNKNGCPATAVELNVEIFEQLIPDRPIGFEGICFDESQTFEYSASEIVAGRGYEWFIIGGEFIGPSNTATVQVNWSTPEIVGEIWYREFSLMDESCDGVSESLVVTVSPALIATLIDKTDNQCNGANEARIEVNVTGGFPPYNYQWNNNANWNTNTLENIPAGIYEVIITDNNGCQQVLSDIIIEEPEIFEVSNIEMTATSCHNRNDGTLTAKITGGTAPYFSNFPSVNILGDQLEISSLAANNHEVEVIDSQGCVTSFSFKISSPLPITVDFRIEKYACPGESNGELTAQVQGGSSPYQYLWSYNGNMTPTLTNIPVGNYELKIIDSIGCEITSSEDMTEGQPQVRLPTGYKPNEGLFEPISNCTLSYQLLVYNRWGELVYSGNEGWNGKKNNDSVINGTYSFVLNYNYQVGDQTLSASIQGSVLVIH